MHKDKPPGLFDFAERGVRYLVGFFFTTGLVLSILVRTGMLIMRDEAASSHMVRNKDTLEAEATARKAARDPNPSAPSPASVRY